MDITTLTDTNNRLNDLEQAAMSGDKIAIQKRKLMNTQWNDQLKQMVAYVSLIRDGSVDLIKSTGFDATKTSRQKKQKIAGLHNFQAKVSMAKGEATVSCKAIRGTNGYVIVAVPDNVKMSMTGNDMLIDLNGIQVRMKAVTVSSATFEGLTSEQRINISMFAFNTAGTSPLTDAQSVVPQ